MLSIFKKNQRNYVIIRVSNLTRKLFFMLMDFFIIIASIYFAFALRFDFDIPSHFNDSIVVTILFLLTIRLILFYSFRVYDISWRHFGFNDTLKLTFLTTATTLFLVIFSYLIRGSEYVIPRSIIPIEFFLSFFFFMSLRVSKRVYLEVRQRNIRGKSTVIVATLDNANTILRTIDRKGSGYYPVAIINDTHRNIKVNGIEVFSFKKFQALDMGCEVAIVDESTKLPNLYDNLNALGITEIKVANDYNDYGAKITDISVEDLLARHPKDLDKERIHSFLKGKVVLVTGAGGSIGSEICRQCERFEAKQLILLDNSEFNLYAITEELKHIKTVPVMQSVVNKTDLESTFAQYKPEVVIHAAAYKHVPLVEANIHEGIVNNIKGTQNLIDTAIDFGVEKLVLISTDKAVRPTNVMGTTKRICELYAQNANTKGTDIVAVRFGNVLGSSGSVIPKFKSQIEKGENITVTHPDITRYFMLIPEACELVLQAGAIGKGGEIFILDMGDPIKIADLAQQMIDLSGRDDIKIEFSGLRPGEKLYEELLIDDSDASTEYESITVAQPTVYDLQTLQKDIENLLACKQNSQRIQQLQKIVPEFNHQTND